MKLRIVTGIIYALLTAALMGVCYAEETEKPSPVVTFSSKYFTKYVGDTGVVFYDRPVVQSEINVALTKGFYVNLWYSMSLAHSGLDTNDGNEFDPTIGWSGDLAGITLDAGITYFDIRPVGTFGRGDVWQPYLEFYKEFALNKAHAIIPYAKTEYGIPAKGNSRDDKGLHVHSGLRHKWQVADKLGLSQQADFAFDDGAYNYSRAWVYSHALTMSYAVVDWLSLELGSKVYVPLSQVDDRSTQVVGNAGFKVTF
ncbi:MAG: TorF family putative porin [Desulfuromonadales bacterium]